MLSSRVESRPVAGGADPRRRSGLRPAARFAARRVERERAGSPGGGIRPARHPGRLSRRAHGDAGGAFWPGAAAEVLRWNVLASYGVGTLPQPADRAARRAAAAGRYASGLDGDEPDTRRTARPRR